MTNYCCTKFPEIVFDCLLFFLNGLPIFFLKTKLFYFRSTCKGTIEALVFELVIVDEENFGAKVKFFESTEKTLSLYDIHSNLVNFWAPFFSKKKNSSFSRQLLVLLELCKYLKDLL